MGLKVLVIGNPIAGSGRGRARSARLVRALEARGHAVEFYATRGAGDARRHAAEREGSVDRIVAAGGDGTLNEIVNGLADPAATPIAPLALGTANMVAVALGVPSDPEALAKVVEADDVLRIDLGSVGATRFLGVVGVGFDALVTEEVRAKRHGPLGYHGYALPILRALARYRPPRLEVRLDGGPPIECGLAIVAKLPNYGGLFTVTPDARMDSGHLDLCLFRNASISGLFGIVWPSWRGTLAKRDDVVVTTATQLAIESIGDEEASVQIDGDAWGKTPIEITVQPRVVPMLVPG